VYNYTAAISHIHSYKLQLGFAMFCKFQTQRSVYRQKRTVNHRRMKLNGRDCFGSYHRTGYWVKM